MLKFLTTCSLVACLTGCGFVPKYNLLVDDDESCSRAWGDYESTLQRRSDMIPQLVAVVQGSAHHEQNTLTAVIQARASATRPEIHLDASKGDLEDANKIAAFQQAQSQLGTALGKLMIVQEKYPELQANKAFSDLQIQIEGTENRILRSREEYNKSVEAFNTELRHVSGKVLNPLTGKEFTIKPYFKADEAAKTAPVISFDNANSASAPAPVVMPTPAPAPVPVAAPAPTIIVVPQYQPMPQPTAQTPVVVPAPTPAPSK